MGRSGSRTRRDKGLLSKGCHAAQWAEGDVNSYCLVPCARPKGTRMASQETNQQKAGWSSGKVDGHTEHQKESSRTH